MTPGKRGGKRLYSILCCSGRVKRTIFFFFSPSDAGKEEEMTFEYRFSLLPLPISSSTPSPHAPFLTDDDEGGWRALLRNIRIWSGRWSWLTLNSPTRKKRKWKEMKLGRRPSRRPKRAFFLIFPVWESSFKNLQNRWTPFFPKKKRKKKTFV